MTITHTPTANGEIYINTDGALLSRRLITNADTGEPLTAADLASAMLAMYRLTLAANGSEQRDLIAASALPVSSVITDGIQTDAEGNRYNFSYCVEGYFTTPSTLYLAEYRLVTTDGHLIVITARGRTLQ